MLLQTQEPDHYIQSAEMYEILSELHWSNRSDSLRAMLAPFHRTEGIVLDVGSGTGGGLSLIAEALPKARIHAIEPSASMRVGLMTRLMLDPELRRRVTVHADAFQQATLPDRIGATLVCGCIGYFDREDRAKLWGRLARRIDPNGFVLADLMVFDQPQAFPDTRVVSTEIGEQRYDIWLQGIPLEPDIIRWVMRFEVFLQDRRIRGFAVERDWHTFGLPQLIDEAAEAGFTATPAPESPVPAAIFRLERP